MSYAQHQQAAQGLTARCAVVTFSDTRTRDTDSSGDALAAALVRAGHAVVERQLLKDDAAAIDELFTRLLADAAVQVILTTGGTGVSTRDVAVDVIERRFDRRLPGFGELFRLLSFQEIGSGALLSRATAGLASGKLIFVLPGSTAAVRLATERLIIPELPHLLRELSR